MSVRRKKEKKGLPGKEGGFKAKYVDTEHWRQERGRAVSIE